MLRRMYSKTPAVRDLVDKIFVLYENLQFQGICISGEVPSDLQVAPLPGSQGRGEHKRGHPHGPIGLLLRSTAHMGSAIDHSHHVLHSRFSVDLPYFDMPFQLFRPSLISLAFDAVHFVSSESRTVLQNFPIFDVSLYRDALPTDDLHYVNVLKNISSLSSVDQATLHKFDASKSDVCIFCECCVSSRHHILWHCSHPALVAARQAHTDDMQRLILEALDVLPLPMLYGLTPPLALLPHSPYWCNSFEEEHVAGMSDACRK
eukprot:10644878-Karenia_brevis.AAC.1